MMIFDDFFTKFHFLRKLLSVKHSLRQYVCMSDCLSTSEFVSRNWFQLLSNIYIFFNLYIVINDKISKKKLSFRWIIIFNLNIVVSDKISNNSYFAHDAKSYGSLIIWKMTFLFK